MNGHAVLQQEQSTRREILLLLKKRGSIRALDMAEILGITPMAVRKHLDRLQKHGYIDSRILRQKMGRPTSVYLIDIVTALQNLHEEWQMKLKNGSLKLHIAVQIGSKLNQEKQGQFIEFLQDTNLPDKYVGKVLHAFALDMPVWSIHTILHIYKLAEKTKAAIVMYNDLMDEFEKAFQQFEYEFLEGELPTEYELLEQALLNVETALQILAKRTPDREKAEYNRFYGDSSSSSAEHHRPKCCSFQKLIGVTEDASMDSIQKQSRQILKKLHPDKGGSAYLFDWVKKAYDSHNAQKKEKRSEESSTP